MVLMILSGDGPDWLPEGGHAEFLEAPGWHPHVCHAGGRYLHRSWCDGFLGVSLELISLSLCYDDEHDSVIKRLQVHGLCSVPARDQSARGG